MDTRVINGYITPEEETTLFEVCKAEYIQDAYIAGGALLRKASPDIDVLVKVSREPEEDEVNSLRIPGYMQPTVYKQYGNADGGKYWIAKFTPLKCTLRKIDLLICSSVFNQVGVVSYMNAYFPFDIQCVAYSIFSAEHHGTIGAEPTQIICNSFVKPTDPFVMKYKGYYPDADFVKTVALCRY